MVFVAINWHKDVKMYYLTIWNMYFLFLKFLTSIQLKANFVIFVSIYGMKGRR